jgi:methylenetetrahydrofolate dehydrogenase (NADP+)/methenyltetrahydrofolate cyclohydrolase
MSAEIIDGKHISSVIRNEIANEVKGLHLTTGNTPGLAVVLVGNDPASATYVRNKGIACDEVGIRSETIVLSRESNQEQVLGIIHELNTDNRYDGILLQLPLPTAINEESLLNAIEPSKDVDGLHPYNVGRLLQGSPIYIPCTPAGVQELLIRSGFDPSGQHVVICGRSNIVGKPLAALFSQKLKGANATVTICHTGTRNMSEITILADILVVAAGRPNMIDKKMIKDNVIIIDVGINRVEDNSRKSGYRLVGDVDFESVKDKAKAITPVPGGVGPMTIAMLLKNTVQSFRNTFNISDSY